MSVPRTCRLNSQSQDGRGPLDRPSADGLSSPPEHHCILRRTRITALMWSSVSRRRAEPDSHTRQPLHPVAGGRSSQVSLHEGPKPQTSQKDRKANIIVLVSSTRSSFLPQRRSPACHPIGVQSTKIWADFREKDVFTFTPAVAASSRLLNGVLRAARGRR